MSWLALSASFEYLLYVMGLQPFSTFLTLTLTIFTLQCGDRLYTSDQRRVPAQKGFKKKKAFSSPFAAIHINV